MGKNIDLSDVTKLDEADIQYGLQRNMFSKAQLDELGLSELDVRAMLAGEAPRPIPVDGRGERLILTDDERDHIIARRAEAETRITPEGLGRVLIEDKDGENSVKAGMPDDYNDPEWTNDLLRAELFSRELSVEGKKRELVARLEEFDTAVEEQRQQQARIDAGE